MSSIFKSFTNQINEFYLNPLQIFFEEKDPEKRFSYRKFFIKNYRGLKDVQLNFTKSDLTLLLGLNESGKTSILKAVESFDFNNDPHPTDAKRFFTSMRNKQDIDSNLPCSISAEIIFDRDLDFNFFRKIVKDVDSSADLKPSVEAIISEINEKKCVKISRIIPFSNGTPGKSFYQFENESDHSDQKLSRLMAQEIIRRSPFILYFEDFQDAIPNKIFTQRRSDAFNSAWYEIIDGLFYNTDKSYSIKKYESYFSKANTREDDARSVLKKVNKTLQKTFTEKWENLSGVQDIEEAELTYNPTSKYFQIKVTERDGTTFSVNERSKGAIWYLAFLMKTEFRRKKLREGSGKPIYLIDEPASNLHSTAQQKMVADFHALVEDTTLVYTTHSRYLISPSNVRNTYVVARSNGEVTCTQWGNYIKGKDAKTSYYQPLYDCLNIIPNNLDIPWEKAIITEGPSDALTLEVMERVIKTPHTHAIYPGTSASDLSTLISLNTGWGTKFKILLDSDPEGHRQMKKYSAEHGISSEYFVLLPGEKTKIENMFSNSDLAEIRAIAEIEGEGPLTKKEFLAALRTIHSSPAKFDKKLRKALEKETIQKFEKLLGDLKN